MSQPDHDAMVRSAIKFCVKNGFTDIKADLTGYEKPNEYLNRIPDIEAYKDGKKHLIEVEDCESIKTTETLEQLKVFSQGRESSELRFIISEVTK